MTARAVAFLITLTVVAGGCSDDSGDPDTLRIYTSVTQETVDAVLVGFQTEQPDVDVDVFRAPTGEINARIAAEQREGGARVDVLWLTDPLSMQAYEAAGSLRAWEPAGAESLPDEFRTDTSWGTRVLNMVIVHDPDLEPAPATWWDLVDAAEAGGVAFPDPAFAGSAFAVFAYFALTDEYGTQYLQALHDAGGVQVGTPGDVVAGVAEGQFAAGITLDFSARGAVEKGSPIVLLWPEPGAISLYSPIAVWNESDSAAAETFVEYVLTEEAQLAIAATGWEPARTGIPWPHDGPRLTLDWTLAFDRQQELLDAYRAIFGG
jgi:iron(III) transport system substrate-binding protein